MDIMEKLITWTGKKILKMFRELGTWTDDEIKRMNLEEVHSALMSLKGE